MKPTYLIDTDWVIHYLNGQPGIVGRLGALKERGLAVSVVSLAEIYFDQQPPPLRVDRRPNHGIIVKPGRAESCISGFYVAE
jgi:hypothetical protein